MTTAAIQKTGEHVGIIGTRAGMTHKQREVLANEMLTLRPKTVSHCCSDGAELEADHLLEFLLIPRNLLSTSDPPNSFNVRMRASRGRVAKAEREAKSWEERHQELLSEIDLLIALPSSAKDDDSGTWRAIRQAWHLGRRVMILTP